MRALVLAGTTSGVGKTTVAIGLMALLRQQGFKVQPFKAGPDYIDPSLHSRVTGQPSRNLDTWMLSHSAVTELFNRAMRGQDIAIIEGVMGLYDGHSAVTDEGSTAELAKLLGAPVVLVLDSRKGARSLAAMVHGYQTFDSELHFGGVILNGIGSDRHLGLCREAIEHYTGVRVLGYLPRSDSLSLPERHLGLVPTAEEPLDDSFIKELVSRCQANFDIPGILRLAEQAAVPRSEAALFPPEPEPAVVKIGIARDRAFSFYYQDSLDLLEAWGAELVPFSPLEDRELPGNISGIYIGGGFPELYAGQLAENEPFITAIKKAAGQGMPLYAECGGLMYLGRSIRDLEGKEHRMVGLIPLSSQINSPRLHLGYRTVTALADSPILRKGETVRGHEFHWSVPETESGNGTPAYSVMEEEGRREGFIKNNLLASYIHLHMGSRPSMAVRLIENCLKYRNSLKE